MMPRGCSSLGSKPRSSLIRPVISSPITPRSLVRTDSSVLSEKSAIFFCVPTPYCIIAPDCARSILSTKSATCFFSDSERIESSICGAVGAAGAASAGTSSVTGLGVGTGAGSPNSRIGSSAGISGVGFIGSAMGKPFYAESCTRTKARIRTGHVLARGVYSHGACIHTYLTSMPRRAASHARASVDGVR